MMTVATTTPALEEWRWAADHARAPRLRSMREFMETEYIPAKGKFAGLKFRCDRQPLTRLWFEEIDSGRWTRHWCTGPSQASKTTIGFNAALLYHLFERRETVICGVPTLDMVTDKWMDDIKPAIEACPRYRRFMPSAGKGSRGGTSISFRLGNGAELRFMTAGGSDKGRAGKTTRVLVITEVDGFDESSETSRESDKLTQLRARLRGWSQDETTEFGECTLSTVEGRTNQEITKGSNSRIVLPCPHCGAWVVPEREDVHGWEDADDEITAWENTLFYCPACQKPWTEEERTAANHACRLVHRGQEIDAEGNISGEPPRTRTLGFRWSAVHNLFRKAGDVGVDLWTAARAVDEENAEKELCQFVFAVPYSAPDVEETPLSAEALQRRTRDLRRGVVPDKVQHLTLGVDMHKRFGCYTLIAWLPDGRAHIADYGTFEIQSDDMGLERATLAALRDLRDTVNAGWGLVTGGVRVPDQVWIDAGWGPQTDSIYKFCRESGQRFRPLVGRGVGQQYTKSYVRPKKTGAEVRKIGDAYHISFQRTARVLLVEINVDFWKTWVHERLASDPDKGGAMTLFKAEPREHVRFTKELTAERLIEEYKPGKGTVLRWEALRRANHYLDSTVYASVAGHFCGFWLVPDAKPRQARTDGRSRRHRLTTPDGRPFLLTERTL